MSRSAKPSTNARRSASSEMSFEIHGRNAHRGVDSGGGVTSSASVRNVHAAASGPEGASSPQAGNRTSSSAARDRIDYEYHRAMPRRHDGRPAEVPPYRRIMPYLMRGKNEAAVYF